MTVLSVEALPPPPRFRMLPSPRSAAAERRRREQELRHALLGGELALHYAVRRVLASDELVAAEAIIRWPHRRRGLVPATEFMPLAESAGLVSQVGGWLLREACRAAAKWQGSPFVCVDVSHSQCCGDEMLDQVAAALAHSGLPPHRLEIEVGEPPDIAAAPGKLDELVLRLAALRDLGVGVALDGFGAGAASLSLLRRLPLTAVKLAGSLVRDAAASREDRAILHAIIQAAHALGLTAIGTGIETKAQRAVLADLGCDEGQGPVFGAPFPPGWAGVPPLFL